MRVFSVVICSKIQEPLNVVLTKTSVSLVTRPVQITTQIILHSLLLSRLRVGFGIKGKALEWLRSYLTNRKQVLQIKNSNSHEPPLV